MGEGWPGNVVDLSVSYKNNLCKVYPPKKLMIYNLQAHVLFQYKITLKLKLTQNKQFFEKMDLFVNSKQQFLQTY